VSPELANDTAGTLAEVKEFWAKLNKPNLMIKIPATAEGIPAIMEATALGININITLIFSLDRYEEAMEAYLQGLEKRDAKGLPIDTISSVASFFVSRVDTKIDPQLETIVSENSPRSKIAASLFGKSAIANAKMAYEKYKQVFYGDRFNALRKVGAKVQRPLWASTSTKNPKYSDVLYVDELIGPETVNTLPQKTLEAFLDHGKVSMSLEKDLDSARKALDDLESIGISMKRVTYELEVEGVQSFSNSFDILFKVIEERTHKTS